jgi:hypothetical protein
MLSLALVGVPVGNIKLDATGTLITGLTGNYTYVYAVNVVTPTTNPPLEFVLGSAGQTLDTSLARAVATDVPGISTAMSAGNLPAPPQGNIGIINTSQPLGDTTTALSGTLSLYVAVPSAPAVTRNSARPFAAYTPTLSLTSKLV